MALDGMDEEWVKATRKLLRQIMDEVRAEQLAHDYPTELGSVYGDLDHAEEELEAYKLRCEGRLTARGLIGKSFGGDNAV